MTKKLERSPRINQLEKLRRHVRILVDLSRLAGENIDTTRFLDQAVTLVARAVEIDHVKLLRYRRKTSDFVIEAGVGWKSGVIRAGALSADFSSFPGRTFQTAEAIAFSDVSKAAGFVLSEILKEHRIVSLANVPVMIGGAAWGVLEIDSTIRRDFSTDTMEFLSAAAAIVSFVVQKEHQNRDDLMVSAAAAATDALNRDILLREMQHRVKNNLQLILASISMQKKRHTAAETQVVLDQLTSRIHAVSLAHDQLALRQGGQVVDLSAYLSALCSSIERQTDEVAIEVTADEINFSIDRALPLGLILNEAITNSIKHAFGISGGRVNVVLKSGVGLCEARMTIIDNGRGSDRPLRSTGSGLKLIEALARQIGGTVTATSSGEGTSIELVFPLIG